MPMKNGNTVALERRMDLASLFCMIGRHGPAVVLAVVAMVSVLAAFVIYRTLRGKRRQATAAAADGDGKRGASVSRPEREPRPEASLSSADSTDVSDEGSSDVREDVDLIQSRPKIRLRCAAAPRSSPTFDRRWPSDGSTILHDAEAFNEDHQENRKKGETDKGVSEKQNRQQEANLQRDLNSQANFDRNSVLSGTSKQGLCDIEPTPEINRREPVTSYSEDEKLEEDDQHPEIIDCSYSTEVKAVNADNHSPQLDKQEDGRECKKEGGDLPVEQVEEQILPSDIGTSGKECESNLITDDSKAPILDIANFKEEKGDSAPTLDYDSGLCALQSDLPSLEEEIPLGEVAALAEKSPDPQHHHMQGQENGRLINNEVYGEAGAVTAPVAYACYGKSDANGTDCGSTENSFLNLPPVCQDQKSEHTETNEAYNSGVHSAADAPGCDQASINAPTMPEGGQQRGFSNTSGADPVLPDVVHPPFCEINLSLVRAELMENDEDHATSPGAGVESGISSMAVSPDLQDACNEFDRAVNATGLPADCDSQTVNRTETQNSLLADYAALSLVHKESSGLALDTDQPVPSDKPLGENADWAKYESSAANEDIYGNEVDESYQNAFEQFMARIAESVTSFTGDQKKKTDVREVEEGSEKRKGKVGSVQKKTQLEAEEEKEADLEKTEISIMEATMDNNEWITDSYQVPPWMNVSVPSFAQNNPKTNHVSTEENQHSSSFGCSSYKEKDKTPSIEIKSSLAPSLVEENGENSKKVVAVQPMPQNVSVTFRIHYVTQSPYQTVAVTGNQRELGDWKEFIPLQRAKDGHWSTVVSLPAESHVEWKFVVLDKGEVCRWEECGNHLLDTGVGDDLVVHKWWGIS